MSAPRWEREGADWPHRTASRFVPAGGLRWHVQIMGEGPVALLLHGTGAATHSWRGLMPLLAARYRVIAPDLPGHGFTPMPAPGRMALPAMAEEIAALLATLDVSPALVIGHSAGAAIGVRMAIDAAIAPEHILSINGALLPFAGIAATLFPAMARTLFVNPFAPRLFALQARIGGETGRFLKRSTGSAIDAAGVASYEKLFRTSGHCAAALAMMAHWDLAPLERDLPRLATPLTLLHGTADRAVPGSVAQRVAALVPRGEAVALPGLGHLAHEEAPEAVMGYV